MAAQENDLHSEEGSMGDYELIDTDGESRDDNATESVASTDFPRSDDVASLADTEKSEDDSDDSGDQENTDDGEPADHTTHLDFSSFVNTPTIGHSVANVEETPIEFEEPVSVGAENVSVKHAIADFSEDRTAEIAEGMGLQNPPKRLVATIHQTMTKQSLAMVDPLRILYVGSHAAKKDIIHKIASSVTASVDNKLNIQNARHASQLYNVVPVSDFGSERTPEIELMQSSGYQIHVEDCASAINMKFEDQPGKPDVIKLTLEGGYSCHSVPEGSEFIVEPAWDLPHVAIIYCSATDDLDARRTRTLAKTFMSRHGVPSLVISHKQIFDKSLGCMMMDQHALHMCLESRDPNGARNIIHQRLPIDLASFLNVDARQMNRNLAYLTGRHEVGDKESLTKQKASIQSTPSSSYLKGVVPDVVFSTWELAQAYFSNNLQSLAPMPAALRVGILAALIALLGTMLTPYIVSYTNPVPSLSINGSLGATTAIPLSITSGTASISSLTTTSTQQLATSTKTTTKTVTVTESKSPNPNSLMSHIDLSTLSETLHSFTSSPSANKEQSCTAEIFDGDKILLRIPAGIKMSWLARGDMSVDITNRAGKAISTENVYSSPDGIILELPKNEAYGIFKVAVVTTKKPKISEVFSIDFGSRSLSHELLAKLTSLMPVSTISKDLQAIDASSFFGKALNETRKLDRKLAKFNEAIKEETLRTAHLATMELVKGSAVITKEIGLRLSDANKKVSAAIQDAEDKVDNAVFKAQIRSKLYWLKLQGKHAEYARYKKRAMDAMAKQADRSAKRSKKSADRAAKGKSQAPRQRPSKPSKGGKKARKS